MNKKASLAIGQIFILLVATLSFAYLLGSEVKIVSGNEEGAAVAVALSPARAGAAGEGNKGSEKETPLKPGDKKPMEAGIFGTINQHDTFMWAGAHLVKGLMAAAAAYSVVKLFGGIITDDEQEVNAIAEASLLGISSFYALKGAMTAKWKEGGKSFAQHLQGKFKGNIGIYETAIPMAIGAALAWYWYTKEYGSEEKFTETVDFQCLSWQAPRGGEDCELCNDDSLPCSEYRCKSLGQSCEIINKGTSSERCVNQNPRDTNPPVLEPWPEKLTSGYIYTDVKNSPPGPGFKIKRADSTNPCIKAYTPIEFGILADEPAQCKIDVEYKDTYEEMATFMSGDNLYKYNHSEYLSLPYAKDVENSSIDLEMGNEMTLYIRCQDSQGNMNQAPYAVQFCIDSSPDTTPPQIKATSIETESCVAADRNSTVVEFYTDEPAQCKWGFEDQAYDSLLYNMSCSTKVHEINTLLLYTCTTELTAVKREGTNYYVRCEDNQGEPKEDRNSNQESFVYSVRGSNPLKMKNLLPNSTIYGGTAPAPIYLQVETLFGCNDNKAVCFYSATGDPNSYVMFFDTDKSDGIHKQRLDLYAGTYTYYYKCVDAGGNVAENSTTFTLDIDTTSPIITRAYEEDDYLKIITVRDSDCVYSTESCDFLFQEGTVMPYAKSPVHIAPWEADTTFYIKCRDEYRNEPIDCSLVVRPKSNFLF